MAPSMEQTMEQLQLIYPIIKKTSPELHCHLVASELGTVFALPWLITWFGHVLPNYCDVVRLYDFFLAGPPLMPIYLAAAIVLHREEEILSTGDITRPTSPPSIHISSPQIARCPQCTVSSPGSQSTSPSRLC